MIVFRVPFYILYSCLVKALVDICFEIKLQYELRVYIMYSPVPAGTRSYLYLRWEMIEYNER